MRNKKDLKHWISSSNSVASSSNPYDEDDEMAPGAEERRHGSSAGGLPSATEQWDEFAQVADRRIASSSIKERVGFLQDVVEPLVLGPDGSKLDSAQRTELLAMLLATNVRYTDRGSHALAQSVAVGLIKSDEVGQSGAAVGSGQVIKYAVGYLRREAERRCKVGTAGGFASSASSRVTLLAWLSQVFAALCSLGSDERRAEDSPCWQPLVHALAQVLESILPEDELKPAARAGALKSLWRAIRGSHERIPSLISTLTATPAGPAVFRSVALLGVVVDVALRLRAGAESVKGEADGVGRGYVRSGKESILTFYSTNIVASKTAVPAHVHSALHDFIAAEVTQEDLTKVLRPVMEKAMLRSPEIALPIATSCFNAFAGDASPHLKALQSPIMQASRSSSATTRARSVAFFGTLIAKSQDATAVKVSVDEILATLKGGKASSPDQRAALFDMLDLVPANASASPAISEVVAATLAKELQEAAMQSAMRALSRHVAFCLSANVAPAASVAQALCKELQNAKVPLRKAVCAGVGSLIWQLPAGEAANDAAKSFGEQLLPGLGGNLKTATTNTLTSPAGPLEGYVAVAVLEGRLASWGSAKVNAFLAENAVMQGIAAGGLKPSFILWDKVYRKATSADEELWFVRALESVITRRASTFKSDESARSNAALALVHCTFTGSSSSSSRAAVESLEVIVKHDAPLAAQIARHGLHAWLAGRAKSAAAPGPTAKAAAEDESTTKSRNYSRPLRALLQAAVSFSESTETAVRQDVLVDFVVLAHHPELEDKDRVFFIDLVQRAQMDPRALVEERLQELLDAARDAIETPYLREAAFAAFSTITLVAPDLAIDSLVKDIESNVPVDELRALTDDDLGIWRTAPGTLFIDILAAKKEKVVENKNRKDAKIEQWEAELRESIARKKAAEAKTLTKEEKAAVDEQLGVETATRARVEALRVRLVRATLTINSLVAARVEAIDGAMSTLTALMMQVLGIPQAMRLTGEENQRAFAALSSCISPRLADYEVSVRCAMLRSIDDELVGADMRREPLGDLVLRVLYRLRFLSEQSPFDLATISFVAPLFTQIVSGNGLGVAEGDADSVAEQVQLALDIIAYHSASCADVRFPRGRFIDDLVRVVAKHTQLAQDAVSALRSLGEALKASATTEEINKLLQHTLADEVYVRSGCLQALQPLDLTNIDFCTELWLACHDEDEENTRLAEKAWEENGLDVPETYASALVPLLEHSNIFVRLSTGCALTEAVRLHPETITALLADLRSLYEQRAVELKPELDRFGLVIDETVGREDPWRSRSAIALAFQLLAPLFNGTDVEPFFDFLIAGEALGDRSEDVRQKMLEAGSAVIDAHGANRVAELIHMFESYLSHPTPPSETNDGITEAVVILFGRLARHLESTDPRVGQVVERLTGALATPSELVQVAVADCLPPLVGSLGAGVEPLMEKLFSDLFHGAKYALRRGSAYGVAGVIKGRGIASIAEFRVMQKLADAIEDRKSSQSRQGAMMAYETLSATLQRLFEPYIPGILPHMLVSFGDTSPDVREATQDTARVIMQNISGYCVKVILPDLLEGLEDKQWRTKKGAIELLGAMAYCAPRQLSASLPTIIPSLNEPLKDSHTQVRQSAERAIKGFGEVIQNPEIKKLVPILLKALVDPNGKTPAAQRALLSTTFVHYIDSPSLALVIPIIDRGLRERNATIQKDASRIVGNLASLTDSKDFVPYLKTLVPLVRVVLVSPVPEARAVAAKALGTLVERLGEVHFADLVPSLLQVLRSDATGVDRQGSAQGLAEVLAALGLERMEGLLPELISGASSSRSYVRAGSVSILQFLPATVGAQRFSPYLPRIIGPIVTAIADEAESVRDVAMRGGRTIIGLYAKSAVDLLLPELQKGMFDASWRVRMSSIQLVADLLFRLSGVSGKNEMEDGGEEGQGVEENAIAGNSIQRQLVEALGQDRRDRVLAGLYILRQDSIVNVRQTAQGIWKALVANTPRTAREVLPAMLDMLIQSLAADGLEQREMAGRTLGELVAKLGERILGEAIPLLRLKGAEASEPVLRAGVCFAVTEILASSTKTQLEDHEDSLIAIVRHGLVDEAPIVRHAAAQAFDSMQQVIGSRAIDETIPTLLGALQSGEGSSETALAALREVMRARGDVVFPVVVPTLTAQPITGFNARALSALVRVAGTALNRRLSSILDALSKSLETEKDEAVREDLEGAVASILSSVTDFDGIHQLMLLLLKWAGSSDAPKRRATGCHVFATFCAVKKPDVEVSDYYVDWVRKLISLFEDPVPEVVDEAWAALDALLKTIPKGEVESLVVPMRRTVETTGSPGSDLPGFCRPKGVAPLVPVFLAGLLNGTAEQREQGAMGLADIVERTSADAIKPFVTSMLGPLIRACGDRHPAAVKSAILYALTTTLRRVPQHTRPFMPQLQRSFQKAVSDASANVRIRAATALGVLMSLQTRVDPVIAELVAGARPGAGGPAPPSAAAAVPAGAAPAADANALAESNAQALTKVLESAPAKNVGAPSRQAVEALVVETFEAGATARENFKLAIAEIFGLIVRDDAEAAARIVQEHIMPQTDAQLASLCVAAALEAAPEVLYEVAKPPTKLARMVGNWCTGDPVVARPAREARDAMRKAEPWASDAGVGDVL